MICRTATVASSAANDDTIEEAGTTNEVDQSESLRFQLQRKD